MERLVIDVDNAANARLLVRLMKELDFVKAISTEAFTGGQALTEIDWVRPGRPASNQEMESMVAEAEAEYETHRGMPLEKAKALTLSRFATWKKENGL